jgi:GxxExxY protein
MMLEDEGYRLMGAAFEVYNQLGYGMAEEIYQQSLEIELALRGIPYQSKRELAVSYKDQLLLAHYRPDLVVYDAIVVELKAISDLIADHEAQLLTTCELLDYKSVTCSTLAKRASCNGSGLLFPICVRRIRSTNQRQFSLINFH